MKRKTEYGLSRGNIFGQTLVLNQKGSVTTSSDGLIFVNRQALFLAKIRALDGRKDGQNSSDVSKKSVNPTRNILTTKVRKSTQF